MGKCSRCKKRESCNYRLIHQSDVEVCSEYKSDGKVDVKSLISIADRMERMSGLGAALMPEGLEKIAKDIRVAVYGE